METITKRTKNVNYVGQMFGSLTILHQYRGKDGRTCVDYRCRCGTERTAAHLANVKTQKNCSRCQRRGVFRKPSGEASFNNLYNTYVQNARLRHLSFDLSKEEFKQLTIQNCFYCGASPSHSTSYKKNNGQYIYNGVDRKDNSKGYTIENSVPACTFCNLTKKNTDFENFINWIRRVYENTKGVSIEKVI